MRVCICDLQREYVRGYWHAFDLLTVPFPLMRFIFLAMQTMCGGPLGSTPPTAGVTTPTPTPPAAFHATTMTHPL